jgi:hypothetical protein
MSVLVISLNKTIALSMAFNTLGATSYPFLALLYSLPSKTSSKIYLIKASFCLIFEYGSTAV